MTPTEAQRVAAAVAGVRPEWRAATIATHLQRSSRLMGLPILRATCVVLALAYDPATTHLGRLEQPGPWWLEARDPGGSSSSGDMRQACPDHPGRNAGACPDCEAAAVADPAPLATACREAITRPRHPHHPTRS